MLLHCIGRYLYICRPVCIDSRGWRSFFILLHLYSGLGASHSQGNFPYNLSRIISHKITTITVGPFRNWMYFGWNLKIGNWNFQWNATTRVVRLKFSAASSKTQTWTTNSGRQISLPSFFCIFPSSLAFCTLQKLNPFQRYISFIFLTLVFYICNLDSNLSC